MVLPHTQAQLNDLAIQKYHIIKMCFLPDAWRNAQNSHRDWTQLDFPANPRNRIPHLPGVYTFVVRPNLFNFDSSSGLFYVGKATNLYTRIGFYIGEINKDFTKSRRPHIWRMVNLWHGYLKFFYTITQTVVEAESIEKEMIKAFRPPFNRQLDSETSQAVRAF